MNYYNENDPKTAHWLKCLVAAELIPAGHIDSRSITEVTPADLEGFAQCHFFAGIGGWSYALALARWPRGRRVWTGSCPCQPFSCAGKGLAEKDARHLWPVFRELIRKRRPPTIFGEQVASAAGRLWYAGVRADLETMGYRVGAADLCAASAGEEGEGRIVRGDSEAWEQLLIGAPHIRQRLYWVADRIGNRRQQWPEQQPAGARENGRSGPGRSGTTCDRCKGRGYGLLNFSDTSLTQCPYCAGTGRLEQSHSKRRLTGQHGAEAARHRDSAEPNGGAGGLGVTKSDNERRNSLPGQNRKRIKARGSSSTSGMEHAERTGLPRKPFTMLGPVHQGNWSNFDVIPCEDNKARRIESGTFPLAAGVPGRVAQLRGMGNAIVPEIATEFIKAYLETL